MTETWRDSLPIDMLLSAVSVLVVAQSSSKIPEGLMNDPVFNLVPANYFLPNFALLQFLQQMNFTNFPSTQQSPPPLYSPTTVPTTCTFPAIDSDPPVSPPSQSVSLLLQSRSDATLQNAISTANRTGSQIARKPLNEVEWFPPCLAALHADNIQITLEP